MTYLYSDWGKVTPEIPPEVRNKLGIPEEGK